MSHYFSCERGTMPAQLFNRSLAEKACERISAAIGKSGVRREQKIQAIPDAFEPVGTTLGVNFRTAKRTLWQTSPERCHINFAVCDQNWEAEMCRILEKPEYPALSYVKNHNLGFEVPYRFAGENHMYRPDFIAVIDDGKGGAVNLVIEVKGERDERDKQKKLTMITKWIPGVNALGEYGRWDFIELKSLANMEDELRAAITAIKNGGMALEAGETDG